MLSLGYAGFLALYLPDDVDFYCFGAVDLSLTWLAIGDVSDFSNVVGSLRFPAFAKGRTDQISGVG